MTIDEALEFADKIYELSWELEQNFVNMQGQPEMYILDSDHPIHECVSYLVRASSSLEKYARGFQDMQFAI